MSLPDESSREYLQLAGPVGLLGLHGGRIEPGTEEIVRFVASSTRASLYVYSGRRSAANLALHRPSHTIQLESRPLLRWLVDHVDTVISVHGHGRKRKCVYVGGLNRKMVREFMARASSALPGYRWISDPESIPPEVRGQDPNNVVNLPRAHGMQLELPISLRQTRPASRGQVFEPTGEALLVCRVLIRLVASLLAGGAQQCRALRQPASRSL